MVAMATKCSTDIAPGGDTAMSTTATTRIPAGTWSIDPSHSRVGFSVKHLGIATVHGTFAGFEGALESAADGALAVRATVEPASVDTKEEQRDAHLRSADFFDAEQHPHITYVSRSVRVGDDERIEIEGDLTVRGVTRPVTLAGELEGFETDPWGGERLGLSLSGRISRGDFGMTFNQVLGSGNLLVSDAVRMSMDVSLVRQAA
jgi:polyisoprenoid-binding protein YceI